MTKNVLYAMFVCQRGFVHLSKNVSYLKDNIVLSFVYQVLDVNPTRMFWIIINGRYQIIDKHAFNNSQDIVLTPSTIPSVANIALEGVVMKKKPIAVSHNSKFSIWLRNRHLLTSMILLKKMALPFLMLLSLFPWIHDLLKSNLCRWMCYK